MTIPRFRLVAVAEAVSWLALLGAVVAKHGFGFEEGTAVLGPIHGVIFLAYLAAVVFLREELGWTLGRTLVAIAAAVIPLGAYLLVERRYLATPDGPAGDGGRGTPAVAAPTSSGAVQRR